MVNALIKKLNQGLVYKTAYPNLWNAGGMAGRYMVKKYANRTRHGLRGYRKPQGTARYAGFRSGRSNRVVSRRRGGPKRGRRRLRWGTRVRKASLGLYEGKRYGRTFESLSVNSNAPQRYEPCDLMATTQSDSGVAQGRESIVSSTRTGHDIHIRGIRFMLHMRNNKLDAPVDIRIICGWRKKFYQNDPVAGGWGHMFKDRKDKQEPVLLGATQEYGDLRCTTMMAPLASGKYFHCEKDMVVRLGPSAVDSSEGSSFKVLPIWWELNNKKNRFEINDNLPVAGDAEANMDWYPVMIFYNVDPSDPAVGQTSSVTYTGYSTVFYKDPIG